MVPMRISTRNAFPVYITLLAVVLLLSCTDREKYHRLLSEAEQQNSNYIPFTTDSAMLDVVDFYDSHGNANERMKAHYLLGCVYRDLGEAPQALQCYHDALDCADTTATDCDYNLLSRIHGQMAMLFKSQYLFETEMQELDVAIACAKKDKDTLSMYSYFEQEIGAYYLLEKYDSMKIVSDSVYHFYWQRGDYESANVAVGTLILYYLRNKDYPKAKYYLEKCQHSLASKSENFSYDGWNNIYYYWGEYYKGIGKPDSAANYYRREMAESSDLNNKVMSAKGLYDLYCQYANADSVRKYADLYCTLNDSSVRVLATNNVQHLQSLYNYERQKQVANQKTIEAERNRMWIYTLALAIVLGIFSAYIMFSRIRQRHRLHMLDMNKRYSMNLILYQKVQSELELLRRQDSYFKFQIEEKETELTVLKDKLRSFQEDHCAPDQWNISYEILNSEIVHRLHEKASCAKIASIDDWTELRKVMNSYMPDFIGKLNSFAYKPNHRETEICILVKLRFIPTEMKTLLSVSSQVVTNIRKRLLQKLFNISEGSASDFDRRIRSM